MADALLTLPGEQRSRFDAREIAWRTRRAAWIEEPVAHDEASRTTLVLLGRAWSGAERLSPDRLLRRYLSAGDPDLGGLGGAFALVIWEHESATLKLASDRLASKKIYCCRLADAVLIATELRALLDHPRVARSVDEHAVEEFLITSHLISTRSLIRGVSVLPAATVRVFRDRECKETRYWTPRIDAGHGRHLDECADRLAAALEPAVRARASAGPTILPLSGGLDSRAVAAFLPGDHRADTTACSFGPGFCFDVRYGRRVASSLGLAFRHLPVSDTFYRDYLAPVQALCDGEVSIEALPIYTLIDAGRDGQAMLMGFLGDVLSGGHLLGRKRLSGAEDALALVWRRKYQSMSFSESELETVLLPERYAGVRGSTRETMMQAIGDAAAETLDEKALIAELYHRQSRYISYFSRLLSSRYIVENPFLDSAVMDAFLGLPLDVRENQRAYRRMLVRHAPRLAALPENRTHKPVRFTDRVGIVVDERSSEEFAGLPAGLDWRFGKLTRKCNELIVRLSGGWLGSYDRNSYVDIPRLIRASPQWFRERSIGHPRCEEWFVRPALVRLFDEHLGRTKNNAVKISNVIAFLSAIETLRA